MTDTHPARVRRWLTTLDHADVARLYLAFATVAALWGATDAMAVRTELLTPTRGVWGADTYAGFFTTHGITMLFFFATPAAFGFANLLLPPLVGADDMAFPRLNAFAFWLLPPALVLARAAILLDLLGVDVRPPGTGWTLYPPLSLDQSTLGVDFVLVGLHLAGISTIATSSNVVVTVLVDREIPWHRVDVFTWALLTTAAMAVFAFPVLGSAIVMLLLDRNANTAFFTADGGGPILWQHLFWFFGHPEVYVLVLPAMGVVSYLLPTYAGRRLFGRRAVVYSTLAIGVLSFGVWAHHMFTTGLDPRLQSGFMAVTLAIAVPSATKTFNWLTTLYGGAIRTTTPMLFCVAAVGFFVFGGVTGVFLAAVPVDLVLQGTYYVVAHFHVLLVGTIVFALFAACYHWFPLVAGRRLDRRLGLVHFWLSTAGVVVTFLPVFALGAAGVPRRLATYPAAFAPLQVSATVGAFLLGVAQLLWLANVLWTLRHGDRVADADPWNLREDGQLPREWAWFEDRRE